jgi:outer membrane protein OmpA-like peptidoglycan-associated protein
MTIFERRRLVVGLVVFAILVLLALAFGIPKIQDDQVAAVERQLQAKGITGVDVTFSGRDGTLSGPAALADPALAAVTDRNGMRSLDYDATDLVEEPATTVPGGATTVPGAATTTPAAASSTVPAALQATANIDGKTVTLGGAVTSDAEKKAVTDAATAAFGPGRVADQLTVTGSPRDPGTAAAFTGFTQLLGASGAAVRSGGLQMSGNVVNFAGTAFSPQAATAFNQALQQLSTTGVSATGSAQPPTQLDAPGLQLSMNDLFGRAGITFASGSAAIDPRSRPTLDTAAQVILAGPTATIEVGGHTDNQGAAATNQRLSLQRAQAVRAYLISKGVPAARLVAKGYGSTKPLVDNATPEGRAQNRRIELTVLGG